MHISFSIRLHVILKRELVFVTAAKPSKAASKSIM